jgi:hypothetical protein
MPAESTAPSGTPPMITSAASLGAKPCPAGGRTASRIGAAPVAGTRAGAALAAGI